MNDYTVVIGTNNIDEYYTMDTIPVMGDKVICKPLSVEVGGMMGNAAAIHANYGTKTYMIDFMADSADSQKIVKSLLDAQVDTSYFTYDEGIPVAKCLIMLQDGERVIFILPNRKEALQLSSKQIDLIKNAGFIYSTITELRTIQGYEEILQLLDGNQPLMAIDVEQGTLQDVKRDWEVLKKCRLLFINDGGDAKLSSLYGSDYIEKLNLGGTIVIRTLGSKGCAVYASGEPTICIPGHPVNPVDTTGAGDTFNASFLHGYMQGWNLQRCAEFANAAAARSTTIFGPRGGIAKEETVWDFFKNREEH